MYVVLFIVFRKVSHSISAMRYNHKPRDSDDNNTIHEQTNKSWYNRIELEHEMMKQSDGVGAKLYLDIFEFVSIAPNPTNEIHLLWRNDCIAISFMKCQKLRRSTVWRRR